MKANKRFLLIEYGERAINEQVILTMTLGEITRPYYSKSTPESIFDTEEEALEEAFKRSKYHQYIVVPIYSYSLNYLD